MTSKMRSMFPAAAHLDGSARIQTVSSTDEPWLHALLSFIKRQTGFGIIVNTSFNVKGKPIINSIQTAFDLLDSLPGLGCLVIEQFFFDKTCRTAGEPAYEDTGTRKRSHILMH